MHFDRRVRTRHVHSREKCGVLLHTSLHTSVELSLFHRSVEFIHKKCAVFFIPHSVCTITTHFLCHYKLSHCLPTCLSYSPLECLSACRSDCLSHCLWSFPLVACLCVFLSVVFLPICLSACPYACLFVPLHVYLPLSLFSRLRFFLAVCLSV